MRRLKTLLLASVLLTPAVAFAQSAAPAASAAPSNPVVASVNGTKIYMSDIQQAAQEAPQELQQLPPEKLFPLLVNQEIDRQALLIAAKKENLQKNPAVAAAMQHAANIKLENAYIQQAIQPAITDAQVQAYYNANIAGKPGAPQVDARHILVPTEAQAKDIISQLDKGADFATLAKKYSTDPGAKDGGELGWFSQDQMVKPFADAAFALQPGKYTETPVQSQFGWHVILLEGKRTAPAPALADVTQQIRQQLADNAIKATLSDVRTKVKIQVFNPDGNGQPAPAAGQ
jgi:peptidyl-prolyl cis-trans isomerase C